jgi:DNA-directed RNA polymerase specialized sigma24 family protein
VVAPDCGQQGSQPPPFYRALFQCTKTDDADGATRVAGPEAGAGRADAEQLWHAVRRLGNHDQEIIYLRFFLDLSVAETADALGIAPGTVKSRLHRSLERLRQVVQQEYPWLIEDLHEGQAAA